MASVEELQNLRAEQARGQRKIAIVSALVSIPVLLFGIATVFLGDYSWSQPVSDFLVRYFKWIVAIFMGIILVGFIFLLPMTRRQARIQRQIEDARLGIVKISSELTDDFEGKLIALNLKYQDRYYLETGLEANRSFYVSLSVAVLGFIMVGVAIVLFFYEKIPAASVSVAAAAITEFISAVFFYLFNKTVLSMTSYHQRLLFTQNIALSLKLVKSLPKDKRERLIEVIVGEMTRDLNLHLKRHPD